MFTFMFDIMRKKDIKRRIGASIAVVQSKTKIKNPYELFPENLGNIFIFRLTVLLKSALFFLL